ncbi:MAG: winged helix-turn-helix domain-containing protein [Candidatus Bathyarchaeia archaeon]
MEELRRMLKIYSVLDNDYRLNILFTIADEPDISFNDIARKTGIEKGLLAYHLGVLKHVGLVEIEYSKRSKKITKYKLTDEGKRVLEKLKLAEKPANL